MDTNKLDKIFYDKPFQWGLRGDPNMWKYLESACSEISLEISNDEFINYLKKVFNDLITSKGKQRSEEIIWFEHFDQSGMSGGMVSLVWWEKTGFPLLKERFELI